MCQLMVASIKNQRLPTSETYYERPELYSYLWRKESENQHAYFDLTLKTSRESESDFEIKEMRLKSMALELVNLVFRLGTSRRTPSYPLEAT